jgi:DNA processing protein
MNPETLHAVIALGLPPSKARAVAEAGAASPEELVRAGVLSELDIAALRRVPLDPIRKLMADGVEIIPLNQLPTGVKELTYPPLGLYFWGDRQILERPTVSIVGTRRASGYGRSVAFRFAKELARAGVTVVSGGAAGIDASAHEGALEGGGKTAAVFLTPIDQTYPHFHGGLFTKIRENGCLISQFPVGDKSAMKYRPIARNQIVAALSQVLVVIEAPLKSGSLSTAGFAGEINRPVMVVPGMIDQPNFEGSHLLIREGAQLVDHVEQVLEFIGLQMAPTLPLTVEATGLAAMILNALTEPINVEKLAEKTKISEGELMAELTDMELDGLVVRFEGKYAKR